MLEERVLQGYWWLPEDGAGAVPDEAHRLCGTLTITSGAPTLEVLGDFGREVLKDDGSERELSMLPSAVTRVLGLSTDGKYITLEDCHVTKAPMSFPGIAQTTYRVGMAMVGAWFSAGEPLVFDELSMRTSSLDAWVNVTGFSQEMRFDVPEGKSVAERIHSTDVGFTPPARIDLALSDGSAWIDFVYSMSGIGHGTTEVKMTQRAWLGLRRSGRMNSEDVTYAVGQLRNFLSLAVGTSDPVTSVTVYQDDLVDRGHRVPVTLYWRVPHNIERRSRAVHPVEMLFTLAEVEPGVGSALDAWFQKHGLFEPVINLYFGVLHHPDLFLEVRFLTLAQALETYDFRRRNPNELSGSAHSIRMKAVLAACPEEWRGWLRMRLSSSNYWTLDQRIRAVLTECDAVSRRIVGEDASARDTFVRAFKNSRNYYTHYTPKLEPKAAKGAGLYLLLTQTRAVIEMSLLRELGFEEGTIADILERCGRFREIAHFRSQVG